MSPITPPTLTRLDPAFPLLWRDVDTVQFGLDGTLRISLTEPWVERLLQTLRSGFRRGSFDVIAHGVGAPREAARDLLRMLQPVLLNDLPPLPPIWVEGVNLADSRVQTRIEHALRDEGFVTADRSAAGAVGVVLVHGAASAHQLGRYLRDDIRHVPVAFEPGGTTIGPLIVPGRTPCLSCRDAHERDRDPAWPSLHAQLIGSTSVPVTAARTAEAAGLIGRLLGEEDGAKHTTSVRITPDGRRAWRAASFHEECLCREQRFLSPRGSARGDAPPVQRLETTRAPAFLQRA